MTMFPVTKVLIVDDHALARQIVINALQELNITLVETATNGTEARDALYAAYDAGRPFDVVFLDWDMPEIEGIDVLKHFRLHPEFNKTAFIMLTAASDQSEVLQAAKSGATSYIVKPASKEVIAKKFNEAVEWTRKQKIKYNL